jgi:hypothetical protein
MIRRGAAAICELREPPEAACVCGNQPARQFASR